MDPEKKNPAKSDTPARVQITKDESTKPEALLTLGIDYLATAIETICGDMMTKMGFTGSGINGECLPLQGIMRTTHTTL
jgi:hypothetical protein